MTPKDLPELPEPECASAYHAETLVYAAEEVLNIQREAYDLGARSTAAQPAGVTLSALVSKWRHAAEHLGLEGLASLSDCADELETAMAHSAAAQPLEPARPDLLERLSYHALERDDLSIDDALSYLAEGWTRVMGRTERQMVMQILDLLASAPAPYVPRIDYRKLIADCYTRTQRPQGSPGCVHFKMGAEWFREQVLAAPPAASGDSTPPSEPVQGDPSGALRPEPEAVDRERGVR